MFIQFIQILTPYLQCFFWSSPLFQKLRKLAPIFFSILLLCPIKFCLKVTSIPVTQESSFLGQLCAPPTQPLSLAARHAASDASVWHPAPIMVSLPWSLAPACQEGEGKGKRKGPPWWFNVMPSWRSLNATCYMPCLFKYFKPYSFSS